MGAMLVAHSKFRHSQERAGFSGALIALESQDIVSPRSTKLNRLTCAHSAQSLPYTFIDEISRNFPSREDYLLKSEELIYIRETLDIFKIFTKPLAIF